MFGFVAICMVASVSLVVAGPVGFSPVVGNRTSRYNITDFVALIEQGFHITGMQLKKLRDEIEINRRGIEYIGSFEREGNFIEKLRRSVYDLRKLKLSVQSLLTPNKTVITPPPLKCPNGWSKYAGRCFKFEENCISPCSADNAKSFCEKHGGYLASSLSSDDDKYFIGSIRKSKNIFLGANDRKTEGKWVWADGSLVTGYKNWNAGEPNDGRNSNCMCIGDVTKKWYDFSCSVTWDASRHCFICERPLM